MAENVKLASHAEPVKTSYVDAVQTVWKRLMSDKECKGMIMWQDAQGCTVFDSVYKLEALVKKAGALSNIKFCVSYILDQVMNDGAAPGEFAVRQLSGKGLPGGKGKIDMCLAKKELSQALKDYASDHGYS